MQSPTGRVAMRNTPHQKGRQKNKTDKILIETEERPSHIGAGYGCPISPLLEQNLPLSKDEWEFILNEQSKLFDMQNWTVDGLRRNFASFNRKKSSSRDLLMSVVRHTQND